MTGDELADTLEAFARTLRLGVRRVNGMTFPLDGGVLVTVPSSGAKRQRRWREKQRSASSPVSSPVSEASREASRERYGPVSQSVTDPSRKASRPAGGPLEVPPTPPSYSPDIPKESVVVPKDTTGLARVTPRVTTTATTASEPRDYESALVEPLCSRALIVQRDPMRASLLRASEWPEVVEVSRAWHEAGGRPGTPRVTQGVVDALIALWAQGYMQSDVLRVARHLPTTDRFRDRVLPSCITGEVMAIALGELERVEPEREAIRARLRHARASSGSSAPTPAPATVGDVLGRMASGGRAAE